MSKLDDLLFPRIRATHPNTTLNNFYIISNPLLITAVSELLWMSDTIAQKILARASGNNSVDPGEIVMAAVDRAMSHDTTALVIKQFGQIGAKRVWDPEKITVVLDHRVPANTVESADAHKLIRRVLEHQGIMNFHDVGEGICHLVMMEKGYVQPGRLIVGTDSHSTTYGALGALGTGVGATEMAAIWATGELWLKVPETIKIVFKGEKPKSITGKDLILHVIGKLGVDYANYRAVEFYADRNDLLAIDDRISICNMSVEMGAKCGIVPYDGVTENYFKNNHSSLVHEIKREDLLADKDAKYCRENEFEIGSLEPQIAEPHNIDNVKTVHELAGIKIHQALLGTCTNGTLMDLKLAAAQLKGNVVHKHVRMIVVPGTRNIYLEALKLGLIQSFMEAGAVVLSPGCGPCMGAHQGLLAPEEVAISSSNRNFRGRMGSPDAEIYLASPATVAASAVRGEISVPEEVE